MDLNQLVDTNQIIKIVPSIEERLAEMGVNTLLHEEIQIWFDHLKLKWKTWKKCPATDIHLNSLFQLTTDPYTAALVCCVQCQEFKDCKPKSLPYCIMEALSEWAQTNSRAPPETIKLPAFQTAINQRNQNFLILVIKTYQINTIKDVVLPIVKDMVKSDNCKQASQIVIAMELFNDIPVEDLIFPLILQDKANTIDEYLSQSPNQVKPLLLFLDKLLDKNCSIRDYAHKYVEENKIGHVKYEKIHYKPLGKLVARLCNKYNIPIETCKNLSKNRTTSGLRYLIYQKYVENNVSSSVWDDLVKDSLSQSECAQEFIDMLADYDINEALKWVSHFKLPEESLPNALKNLSIQEVPSEEERWDNDLNETQNCYKFNLPENNITIIDTSEKFYDVVTSLVNCGVISIDCEWKPSFGAAQSQVALIQIATFSHVYLIDTLILNNKQYTSFWYRFNKSLLDNAEIIKVGFGLEQDLKEIKASITGLGSIKVKGEGLLDLSLLWKSLINMGLSLPSNSSNGKNSLSSLVQACFGVALGKAEQCSNWELRPLRKTQINYAALDAYVLLEIYNYLQKLCVEQKINFDEICNYVMLENKIKNTKRSKVADRLQASTKYFKKSSKEVKMLVAYELSNLATYLRYCDIDTIVASPTLLWHDTVNMALSQNRFILVSKMKFTPTLQYSQNFILDISKGNISDQFQKILSSFNIILEPSKLFNRCLKCNSKDFTKLSPDDVKDLCEKYQASTSKNCKAYKHNDDEDDDPYYDNFLSDSDGDDLELYQPLRTPQSDNTSTAVCVTRKGAQIDISGIDRLTISCKSATLCETCGKLYWDEDPELKTVRELISTFIVN